jgi:hypothetical protein
LERHVNEEIIKILKFQDKTNIKCLHNEVRIIKEILENGPLPSLEIMKKTVRSISGHNQDLKILVDINALTVNISTLDKRKKIYDISENIKSLLL